MNWQRIGQGSIRANCLSKSTPSNEDEPCHTLFTKSYGFISRIVTP